jgi:PAS domain S-box-containing protein
MIPATLFQRYQQLQQYVGWTDDDGRRIQAVAPALAPALPGLVDDFYAEIQRHGETHRVITGGAEQIERLKGTLRTWLDQLLAGPYDATYVARRWRVGHRHVEIGLDQVFTNAALSRLRMGLLRALAAAGAPAPHSYADTARSLNTLLDLDLAIIEDAYQAEYLARMQRIEVERRRLLQERSEAVFGTLVEAAPCMIVILRPDQGIIYLSQFAEELTGFRAAEVKGRNYSLVFLPPDCRDAFDQQIQGVLAGVPSRGFESRVLCKEDTYRSMIWNVQRLPEYEGRPAVLAVGQDITLLKQAQDAALQATRLAAIGQMMAGLAHESGNALARSQACLEMLKLEVEDRPEALELIQRIQKAQDHLGQLYEEVRGYAAPLRLARERWSLALVWRQAWQNLAVARQGRSAVLLEHTNDVDLHCGIDPFRVEQVFRNILENALAACSDPVRIEITCHDAALDGGPALRIGIRDNGPGLTPVQRQRIFEPFFTTKTKGTGLGMAIAQRIVQAHDGRIAVGKDLSPGAEILLTLPRGLG